jgi:hypothetical protein
MQPVGACVHYSDAKGNNFEGFRGGARLSGHFAQQAQISNAEAKEWFDETAVLPWKLDHMSWLPRTLSTLDFYAEIRWCKYFTIV